ncbi:hypothetical protein [Azospirillum picis]|uniref:Uncharacterized protein n=1 Tax=Azospirillum picis TaxID=488438 RepID=A0ABU0MMB0_9PROT|nr:hypothetical protein [Azospirillum picis]MBP2300636.1 hypothetical protein [Azospirillum picis]MDQ0534605.1 hypothetical protein [Azospirillum picis]
MEPEPSQPFHAAYSQLADFPERLDIRARRLYHMWQGERERLAAACAAELRIALAEPSERISLQPAAHAEGASR